MALEKTNAALADLKNAVAAIVSAKQADEAQIAELQNEVASADAAAASDIGNLTAAITMIVPAPVAQADPAQ